MRGIVRSFYGLTLCALPFAVACYGGGSGSKGGASGNGGMPNAGAGGSSMSAGGSAGSGVGGSSGGSTSGGAASGGASAGGGSGGTSSSSGGTTSGGSSGGTALNLYVPPAEIIGGACEGTPTPATAPCSDVPEQVYCALDDPTHVIMVACTSAGRSQCEVMSECEPGWHACTATDYVARGGRDVAPAFSTATDRAWLAACVRDVTGTEFKNEPCSVCGQDPPYEPSIQWWCDGEVVYAGGMSGDTLGVLAAPECMRVGENTAGHAAFWSMSFSDGAPSLVMCCLDNP